MVRDTVEELLNKVNDGKSIDIRYYHYTMEELLVDIDKFLDLHPERRNEVSNLLNIRFSVSNVCVPINFIILFLDYLVLIFLLYHLLLLLLLMILL